MKESKYPRKGLHRPIRGLRPCQVCCSATACATIDIELNEIRGDDTVVRVCGNCQRLTATWILSKHLSKHGWLKGTCR